MTAEGVEVRATNGPAFFGALSAMAAGLADLREPLDAAATLVVAAARAAAPRRTGHLAGAHTVARSSRNRLRVTVATPYAAPVHWGWPAHGIRRQPWVVASFNRDTAWMDRMTAGVQADLDREAART